MLTRLRPYDFKIYSGPIYWKLLAKLQALYGHKIKPNFVNIHISVKGSFCDVHESFKLYFKSKAIPLL